MDYYYGRSRAQDVALWGGYSTKVMGYGPIAYWPLWEASGSAAVCQVNAAQNGTHTNVTLGQTGIGDGNTCPLYNGTSAYTDIYSATFASAFSGAEGTLIVWAKVSGSGVWTDAGTRFIARLQADAENYIYVRKWSTNNRLIVRYEAGNTLDQVVIDSLTTTGWMCWVTTWSKTADQLKVYLDGVQQGTTQTGLGTWAGNLDSTQTIVGADSTTPSEFWSGYCAHVALWDTALSATAISDLASV